MFDSITSNCSSVFTSKFWSSLCYFLSIKRKLSTPFYPQTDSQSKQQNSIIEIYLRAFVNYKKDNWARLLLMVEFAYNNAKHASMEYTSFELNCKYHLYVSYKENVEPHSRSKVADELIEELRNLIAACRANLQHTHELQK